MQGESVGQRYAKALFELTKNREESRAVGAFLSELGSAVARGGPLADLAFNPRYPNDVKRSVLGALGKRYDIGSVGLSFIDLLLRKNRVRLVASIAVAFQRLIDDAAGVRRVTVTTAQPMSDAARSGLCEKLESVTGRTVVADFDTNEALLAGVVVRSGSLYFDGSVKGQLERLRQRMLA